ncbi:hypothetical protein H4R34_003853 [Dimargaris verticillata]|uniref:Uncharacterized protein n=1 Tax=Dimargaris verticillata TaxID=2761393 RepID=A0A9W8B630_9FUNG|nr:hypothetical protein H4R34_003853 [Dimargaris verticillata]
MATARPNSSQRLAIIETARTALNRWNQSQHKLLEFTQVSTRQQSPPDPSSSPPAVSASELTEKAQALRQVYQTDLTQLLEAVKAVDQLPSPDPALDANTSSLATLQQTVDELSEVSRQKRTEVADLTKQLTSLQLALATLSEFQNL